MKATELIQAISDYTQTTESKLIDPKHVTPRPTKSQVAKALEDYIDQRIQEALKRQAQVRA